MEYFSPKCFMSHVIELHDNLLLFCRIFFAQVFYEPGKWSTRPHSPGHRRHALLITQTLSPLPGSLVTLGKIPPYHVSWARYVKHLSTAAARHLSTWVLIPWPLRLTYLSSRSSAGNPIQVSFKSHLTRFPKICHPSLTSASSYL